MAALRQHFASSFPGVPVSSSEAAVSGKNWGEVAVQHSALLFSVGGQPAFRVDCSDISNVSQQGKTDVLLELASGRAALVLLGACAALYAAECLFSRRGLRLGLAFSELVLAVALLHAAMALAVPSGWLGDHGRANLAREHVAVLAGDKGRPVDKRLHFRRHGARP